MTASAADLTKTCPPPTSATRIYQGQLKDIFMEFHIQSDEHSMFSSMTVSGWHFSRLTIRCGKGTLNNVQFFSENPQQFCHY